MSQRKKSPRSNEALWLSVDPGTQYIGIACWKGDRLVSTVLMQAGKYSWYIRASRLADSFQEYIGYMKVEKAFIEFIREECSEKT